MLHRIKDALPRERRRENERLKRGAVKDADSGLLRDN